MLGNASRAGGAGGGPAGWRGLSLRQPKPEETQAGPVTCPDPVETVLLADQPPASVAFSHWEEAGGNSDAWACGERSSQKCGSGVQLCLAFAAALPAGVPRLGRGVGAKKRDAEGSGLVGSGEAFPGMPLLYRSPPAQQHSLTRVMPSLAALSPGLALLGLTPVAQSFCVSDHSGHGKTRAIPMPSGGSALGPW